MLGGASRATAQSFIRRKEVCGLCQGPAQRRAILILPEDAAWQSRDVKKPPGIGGLVAHELKQVSVKLRAARLGDDVDHGAPGLRELRRSERALDPKLRYRLH